MSTLDQLTPAQSEALDCAIEHHCGNYGDDRLPADFTRPELIEVIKLHISDNVETASPNRLDTETPLLLEILGLLS